MYYGYNFNRPIGRVNLLRAYDVTSNNFTVSQANVIVESTPAGDSMTFAILVLGTIVLVGALCFLPALALGPIADAF